MSAAVFPSAPDPAELAESSAWLDGVPGLRGEALEWLRRAPERRTALARRAAWLTQPLPHPAGVGRLFEMLGRTAAGAGTLVGADVPRAVVATALHGAAPDDLTTAAARRAERVVRAGGPVYVKLGQFISSARGLLPDEIVEAFSWCVDDVEPMAPGRAQSIVEREFARPLTRQFADFDDKPLAAGSIAQLHGARLKDGRAVVVKVRRRGLRRTFEADIRALSMLATLGEWRTEAARSANVRGVVALFAELALQELDLRLEAANMVEVGLVAEHSGLGHVRCPRPLPGMVTERVIVMERLDGVRFTDAPARLHEDVDRDALLRLAVQGVLESTLVYGVFHGDLHAGNVLVDTDGSFGLVDFGIVGRLDQRRREALIELMIGIGTDDVARQVRGLDRFGAIAPDTDVEALSRELTEMAASHREALTMSQAEIADRLGALIRLLASRGVRVPKELVLFLKNLLYLNAFAAAIAPEADLLAQIGPIYGYFAEKYPEAIAAATAP
jgi:ubiquinone biosynthesis protein